MHPTVRRFAVILIALGTWVMLVSTATAENELRDKVTAHLVPGDSPNSAIVELWMSNTNNVLAMSLPFKFAAGDSLVYDSLVTAGGRAAAFAVVKPIYRPENQTLLVHLMWAKDTSMQAPPIPPGTGPLMKVYFHTPGAFPMKDFRMVNVELPPQNVLMFVTETMNSVTPAFEFTRENPPGPWGATAETPKPGGGK